MVNTIWFRLDLIRFRKDFSVRRVHAKKCILFLVYIKNYVITFNLTEKKNISLVSCCRKHRFYLIATSTWTLGPGIQNYHTSLRRIWNHMPDGTNISMTNLAHGGRFCRRCMAPPYTWRRFGEVREVSCWAAQHIIQRMCTNSASIPNIILYSDFFRYIYYPEYLHPGIFWKLNLVRGRILKTIIALRLHLAYGARFAIALRHHLAYGARFAIALS